MGIAMIWKSKIFKLTLVTIGPLIGAIGSADQTPLEPIRPFVRYPAKIRRTIEESLRQFIDACKMNPNDPKCRIIKPPIKTTPENLNPVGASSALTLLQAWLGASK